MTESPPSDDSGSGNSAPQSSDEELFFRFRDEGDREAFESLVRRYGTLLYNYLLRYLRDATLAEEAFQRTVIKLYERADLFSGRRSLRPWLYRIATNQAIDVLRREGKHKSTSLSESQPNTDGSSGALQDLLEDDLPTPLEQLMGRESREWARRAVDDLPEDLRAVVLLIYYQSLKYREAAEVLGVPEGTVKSRSHKAMLRLSEAWRRDNPEAKG